MSSSSSICVSEEDNDENRLDSNETEFLTSQKNLIYKHPLFPVLVYVLERCEQATVNPSLLANQDDTQTSSSSSFEHNLKLFLSKNPSLLNHTKSSHNEETSIIDNFYIDAMQVLRIHLLELDKVNDLCRDFCQRYIACLKVKLNANTLFAGDEDDDYDDVDIVDDDDDEDIGSHIDDDYQSNDEMDHDSSDDEQNSSTFQHRINRKQTTYSNYTTEFDGQTPLSQIISKGSSKAHDPMSCSPDESPMKRRKQAHLVTSLCQSSKRGVLPKSATSIMRSWLFQHIVSFSNLKLNLFSNHFLRSGSSLSNRR